jgi:hypothetical protein
VALTLASTATGASAQSRTLTAPGFHHSVGIATHPTYKDTPYGLWNQVVAKFQELGVKHMRSGIYASDDPVWNAGHYADLTAIANAGVKLHLVIPHDCSPDRDVGRCLDAVKTRLPSGSVDFLEWPDERDRPGGSAWVPELVSWGRRLYLHAKADPLLRHVPVVGPSLVRNASAAILGDQSAFLDRGAIQPYTGALSPRREHILAELARIRAVSGDKPVIAAEVGFHTALRAERPEQPAADEATAAVYTLRALLEHYADGIERTYLYELVDESVSPTRSGQNYGLLRTDFSPKPAFTAVKNLLTMVGTTGPARVTPLQYRVSGEASDLRDLVLQQDARTYLLVLWRTASVWDRVAQQPLAVAPRTYTVEVPALAGLARGNPHAGPALAPATAADRFTQSVGAHPVVLRLTIAPGGQGAGFGPGWSGIVDSGSGARDRTRPRVSRIKVRKITRKSYAVSFRLSERALVGIRIDRARKGSSLRRPRYRLLRRTTSRVRPRGSRRVTIGNLVTGRHRVLIGARDAAGNQTYVLAAFKARRKPRR